MKRIMFLTMNKKLGAGPMIILNRMDDEWSFDKDVRLVWKKNIS
jgi:hypothetical protein